MIQLASLVAAGIDPTQARRFETPLQAACTAFEITTPVRQAAFVAQCAHESRHFSALEEGLFYRSPERICAMFRSSVPDVRRAQPLACNPKALANHVYANRLGNGDIASGDGWRYRGRGLIQLTGRHNYERAAAALGRPYVEEPDRVAEPEDSCLTAAWFWHASKLNALADALRIDAITRAINGPAMAGAKERRELFSVALEAFQTGQSSRSARHPLPRPVPEPADAADAVADAAGAPARAPRRAPAGAPAAHVRATPVLDLAWTVRNLPHDDGRDASTSDSDSDSDSHSHSDNASDDDSHSGSEGGKGARRLADVQTDRARQAVPPGTARTPAVDDSAGRTAATAESTADATAQTASVATPAAAARAPRARPTSSADRSRPRRGG